MLYHHTVMPTQGFNLSIYKKITTFVAGKGYIVPLIFMVKITLERYYFRTVFRTNKFHSFHKWGRSNSN